MAGRPAVRMSVRPGTSRNDATSSTGQVAMLSPVVTPCAVNAASAARPSGWMCASINPGNNTPPAASTTSAPVASAPITAPSITTVHGSVSP
jgi:hypothetical protein